MLNVNLVKVEITPGESVPMMGYGDRVSWSKGIHDPLYAYVLYVKPEDRTNGNIFIVPDLCLFSIETALQIREELSSLTGFQSDEISITATHTHSGPNVRFLEKTGDTWESRYFRLLVEKFSEGIQRAVQGAFQGSIEVRTGSMQFGVNRRRSDLPNDPRVVTCSLIDTDGNTKGCMFYYSCHLTALGVDNYLISSDWVGPVRETFEAKLGVPFGFIQGAEGNIDPVCRGLLYMEDPDQAKGVSFDAMEETSGIAVRSLEEILNTNPVTTLETLSVSSHTIPLPLRFGALGKDEVGKKVKQWKESFAQFLDIPVESVPEDQSINALIKEKCRADQVDSDTVLRWVAEQFTYCGFLSIYKRSNENVFPEKGEVLCPITLWDFGSLFFLGIPAEVLVENSFHLQEKYPDTIALIASLFNGWLGYLPHRDNFHEKEQAYRYETISTLFSEDAGDMILDYVKKVRP